MNCYVGVSSISHRTESSYLQLLLIELLYYIVLFYIQ